MLVVKEAVLDLNTANCCPFEAYVAIRSPLDITACMLPTP